MSTMWHFSMPAQFFAQAYAHLSMERKPMVLASSVQTLRHWLALEVRLASPGTMKQRDVMYMPSSTNGERLSSPLHQMQQQLLFR